MDNQILLKSLHGFYEARRMNDLVKILNRKNNDVSLRLIDWFTTNYAKKHNTRIKTKDGTYMNVYIEYKNQLKAFSKRQFDPFCRRERILFEKSGHHIKTTIGQLNFFRWALYHDIVSYVKKYNRIIETDMLDAITKSESNTKGLKRNNIFIQRKELSSCATKCFTCIELPCIIQLD